MGFGLTGFADASTARVSPALQGDSHKRDTIGALIIKIGFEAHYTIIIKKTHRVIYIYIHTDIYR